MSNRLFEVLLAGIIIMGGLFSLFVLTMTMHVYASETEYIEYRSEKWADVVQDEPSLAPRGQRQLIWSAKVEGDLDRINREINSTTYRDDMRYEGVKDRWRARDVGLGWDCEDWSIAKMLMLVSLGYPSAAMSIEVGYDVTGVGHAVLRVETTTGSRYLDAQRNDVYDDRSKTFKPYYRTSGVGSMIVYPAAQ